MVAATPRERLNRWRRAFGAIVSVAALATATLLAAFGAKDSWHAFGCDSVGAKLDDRVLTNGERFDVIVFGGTPSGAAAARAASERGASVLVLSANDDFGGAIANGLGATDIGAIEANLGLARTFLDDVRRYYGTSDFRTEPKVAECLFERWLDDPNITAVRGVRLEDVTVTGGAITSLMVDLEGKVLDVVASDFVDASYATDLAALAGTEFRLGMGDFYDYDEGALVTRSISPYFTVADAAAATSAITALPQVTGVDDLTDIPHLVTNGTPSFTFRLCVTRDESNRIPFRRSVNYDTYAPAWRLFMENFVGFDRHDTARALDNGTTLTQLWRMAQLPNDKVDLNAAPSSFTNFPMPAEYFENPSERPAILATYQDYFESFLWFVQNDPSVPEMERAALDGYGLCADEFVDNGGWPHDVYLREGRRIVGSATMTATDLTTERTKPDAIAIGSYAMDSKPTVFLWSHGTFARDRGDMIDVPLYDIPFGAMIPANGPRNLVVSVGISASPLAFSSVRMEPQFMQLGEAAGIAAAIASSADHAITPRLASEVLSGLAATGGFRGVAALCSLAASPRC